MMWEHVLLDKKDHIATMTLNRPEKMNAFGRRMRHEIEEVVREVCEDAEVRVIVITGAGKAFCVGGDVNEKVTGPSNAVDTISPSERPAMSKIVMAISQVEKPVIAAVNGVAAGGGVNLALCCDIRIASKNARFGQVYVRRGIHPDWGGIYFLPRLVGYAKACELIFSGDVIDAEEAYKLGMVNKVVPHDDLMPAVYDLAGRIAKNAPIPIALAKRGLQNFNRWDLPQALDYEAYALSACRKSEDVEEGFKAFLEKRDPKFTGMIKGVKQ
jgi:enoyl-CoA hydratase/carnithine racemase